MKKKVIVSITSFLILIAGSITGFFLYKNSLHPAYGIYYADDFNGKESYITLDEKSISFTNVDFSSIEKANAVSMAHDEIKKSDEEDLDKRHKKMNERASEIQKTLDFESTFNGNTFEATDYEKDEFNELYLIVYDQKKDYEIWLNILKDDKAIRCGDVLFKYKE